MAERDPFSHIDTKLDRLGDEVARGREAYADFKSVVADCKLEFVRNREAQERAARICERLEELGDKRETGFEQMANELTDDVADLREEIIAQRESLFRILDQMRLWREGPGAD